MSRAIYDFELYQTETIHNIKHLLAQATQHYGERIAFVNENADGTTESKTYQQFQEDVATMAAGLVSALKIDLTRRDGKKIALLAPNSYWWVVCYFATVTIGQVIVPLDPQLPAEDLVSYMKKAGVSSLFFDTSIDEKVAVFKEGLAKIKHYISLGELTSNASINIEKIRKMGLRVLNKKPDFYEQAKIYPEMLSTLMFTSGTTAAPKAIMLTHKNFVSSVMGVAQLINFNQETLLSMLPLFHSYEFTVGLLLQLYSGSTIYYLQGGLRAFRNNLQKVRPTFLVLVPLILEETYKRVRASLPNPDDKQALAASLKDYYGGRLKRLIVGGAPCNEKIAAAYEECGITVLQGYGATECAPVITMNADEKHNARSAGLPLPNLKVKIENPDENGEGEVIVRGPSVMLGYYKDERQTDKVLIDNWLHTGDYGKFDEQGFVYIVGRKKNVIIGKNAKKIYPEEIEFHLQNTPGIKEAMVYGKMIDDDTKVAALIVPDVPVLRKLDKSLSTHVSDEEILAAIRQQVAAVNADNVRYKQIVDVALVSSLPRTNSGKVKRSK